jgi:HAD superfamily hydrolase (TIGR01509 family)
MPIDAVIFDLDGVLIDSEPVWSDVRKAFVQSHGGRWPSDAGERMIGMSTSEWARFIHDDLGVAWPADQIASTVVGEMVNRFAAEPSLFPGAVETVRRLARRWPLGLASSAPVRLIAAVLEASGLASSFRVAMSTEQTARGKPAPDVYLAVAHALEVSPDHCAAIEGSTNGLKAARAAGMRVIAIPNRVFAPSADALAAADAVVNSLTDLTDAVVAAGK